MPNNTAVIFCDNERANCESLLSLYPRRACSSWAYVTLCAAVLRTRVNLNLCGVTDGRIDYSSLGCEGGGPLMNRLACCVYLHACLYVHLHQQLHFSSTVVDDKFWLFLSCAEVAAPHCNAHRSGYPPAARSHLVCSPNGCSAESPRWLHSHKLLAGTFWPKEDKYQVLSHWFYHILDRSNSSQVVWQSSCTVL